MRPDTIDCVRENQQRRDMISRTVSVRAETIDVEERSVEAVLASENMATVFDWYRYELIDEILVVRGATLPRQVPMLESHARWGLDSVLGSVRNLRVEGEQIVCRLVFAEGDEAAEKAWNKVRQGHITDVSVGYRVEKDGYVDIPPGETRTVNGKAYTAGARTLRISTRWAVREGSLVAIGADEAAKIREDAGLDARRTGKETTMNEGLRRYLAGLGLRSDASTAEAWNFFHGLGGEQRRQAEALKDAPPATPAPAPTPPPPAPQRSEPATPAPHPTPTNQPATPDLDAVRQEAAAAERRRIDRIRELAGNDTPAELVTRAINDGWTADRAGAAFLQAMRDSRSPAVPAERGVAPAVIVRDHDRDCTREVLAAAMVLRAGRRVIDPSAPDSRRAEQERLANQAERFMGMSMVDHCREALRLDGVAMPISTPDQIRAAVSTASLSYVYSHVVDAVLLDSFMTAGDTTQGWVREVDVSNFKTNDRIRLGQLSKPKRLPRGSSAEHATVSDLREQYAISRYAEQFVVDEQDIIDDDLNALMQMPEQIGRATAELRPDMVYALLLANANMRDSVALFHAATHGNLGTTSTALAASTLEAGIIAMAKQTEDGRNLNLRPQFLIVPQDLRFTAEVLLKSVERVIASASGGTYNPLRAENIQLVSDNRIGVAGVTDPASGTAYTGTATNWFLAASPVTGQTIEVGYLAGTGRRPRLRSFVLDRGQWGMGWDVNFDLGVKALDWRGLYKATGAS